MSPLRISSMLVVLLVLAGCVFANQAADAVSDDAFMQFLSRHRRYVSEGKQVLARKKMSRYKVRSKKDRKDLHRWLMRIPITTTKRWKRAELERFRTSMEILNRNRCFFNPVSC